MMDLLHLFWIVFIPEYYGENDSQHQRITGKTEPDTLPVLNPVFGEIVNHFTTDPCPKPGSHAICHQHEQSLGTCPDAYVGFFFYKQRPRDIKEVESHTIHNHGKNQKV